MRHVEKHHEEGSLLILHQLPIIVIYRNITEKHERNINTKMLDSNETCSHESTRHSHQHTPPPNVKEAKKINFWRKYPVIFLSFLDAD
mmetsp:Transcript_21844/g.32159  ORF Transcript_21844/g.32159 Transcript_21844/m.32159 type:complete len:88 (-) Transcript_21844:489-752(-)